MYELISKTIENHNFKLMVDMSIPTDKLGGQPILNIDDEEYLMVYSVEVLNIFKALYNNDTLINFLESVRGTYIEFKLEEIIKKFI